MPLPQNTSQYFFFFTDPFHNQVPIDPASPDGAQKIGALAFYKTEERPKIDNLNTSNEIIGQYIDITASLSAFLMNEETGATQEINYTTAPSIPQNAKYLKIEFESYHLANSIEVLRDGSPLTLEYIDNGNAEALGVTNANFISDEYYVDLVDPRQSLSGGQTKPIIRSTMSGEIHNKFRI
ncbi:MAG: hypothetical protein GY830_03990 [Bacteroidetes bacterium]|nr:hypothetical protein [Bacteroidota bacterium]